MQEYAQISKQQMCNKNVHNKHVQCTYIIPYA